ncbi:hypothetical protein ACJW31_08G179400 [Castanea mollissima]
MPWIQSLSINCDHPSELFGFVNEDFQNFVKEWTAETLSRELDYVKLLASWKVLYNSVEAETPKLGKTPISSGNEQGKESNGIAGTSQDPSWLKSVYSEKAPQLDRAPVLALALSRTISVRQLPHLKGAKE